ncbi:MAG: response regulator [bacterium]
MKNARLSKILIVDDDLDLCLMLSRFLRSQGYQPEHALSGEEALDKIYAGDYDLVILDVMMPGIDGCEVCHRLKMQKEYNRLPILMLSAKDTEQDKIVGLKTGADGYVFKPFDIDELLAEMNSVFNRRRQSFARDGLSQEIAFHFESRFKYLEQVNEFVSDLFLNTSLASEEIWELKLALHELGINAIEHGNRMDPAKAVRVKCRLFRDRLEFEIEDEGEGFTLEQLPDPTAPSALVRERGRGIFLVSRVVDEVHYDNGGSRVRLIKYLNGRTSTQRRDP